MRVAYLIAAHNDPAMLELSLRTLDPYRRAVFVHIDAKSDIEPFRRPGTRGAHFTTQRFRVYWGNDTVLQTMLHLLRTALAEGQFDYFKMLSNADFPVQPVDAFEAFLQDAAPASFQCCRPALEGYEGNKRLGAYYVLNKRDPLPLAVQRFLFSLALVPTLRRRPPPALDYLLGSSWFTIHRDVAEWAVEYWDSHPEFRKYFSSIYIPDEIVLPTLTANTPGVVVDERNIIYSDFGERRGKRGWQDLLRGNIFGTGHPAVLDLEDLPAIRESGAFFARKMSSTASAGLLRRICEDVHGFDPGDLLGPDRAATPAADVPNWDFTLSRNTGRGGRSCNLTLTSVSRRYSIGYRCRKSSAPPLLGGSSSAQGSDDGAVSRASEPSAH